jgi:hypothetical protein
MLSKPSFWYFYAIFWGNIASAQLSWKAFHWPFFFKIPQARNRTLMAVIIFNVMPLIFFGYVMWALAVCSPKLNGITPVGASWNYAVRGVLPAFAVFGFYRWWLAIIELLPDCFYASCATSIDKRYRHVEPTYRREIDCRTTPVVDLGDTHTGLCNLGFGTIYVAIPSFAPWYFFIW